MIDAQSLLICDPLKHNYCLHPGWHNVELRYSKSPLDTTSVFKFFVIDAEQVETIYNSGVPSKQIQWKVYAFYSHLACHEARQHTMALPFVKGCDTYKA